MHKYLESNYHSAKLKIPCAQFILTNSNSKQEHVCQMGIDTHPLATLIFSSTEFTAWQQSFNTYNIELQRK